MQLMPGCSGIGGSVLATGLVQGLARSGHQLVRRVRPADQGRGLPGQVSGAVSARLRNDEPLPRAQRLVLLVHPPEHAQPGAGRASEARADPRLGERGRAENNSARPRVRYVPSSRPSDSTEHLAGRDLGQGRVAGPARGRGQTADRRSGLVPDDVVCVQLASGIWRIAIGQSADVERVIPASGVATIGGPAVATRRAGRSRSWWC